MVDQKSSIVNDEGIETSSSCSSKEPQVVMERKGVGAIQRGWIHGSGVERDGGRKL